MKLIVGLGNPEDKYVGTRHNLGFLVVDEFNRKINGPEWQMNSKLKAEISKTEFLLARPQTYMNNSGMAVARIAAFYKVVPADVIVVHDELDLPLGQIKIRQGGAAAGHHGVESIIDALGTDQFVRVRLGIGNLRTLSGERKGNHFAAERFVLEPFTPQEHSDVKKLVKQAVKSIELLLEKGLEKAQNQFN